MTPPTPSKTPRYKQSSKPKPVEVIRFCDHCDGVTSIYRDGPQSVQQQLFFCHHCGQPFDAEAAESYARTREHEFQTDCWDIHKLGIASEANVRTRLLNFKRISQPWLRESAKHFIKLILSTLSVPSAICKLNSLARFSRFLAVQHPYIQPEQLTRTIIVDYLAYLAGQSLRVSSRIHLIHDLRDFLDRANQEQWLPIGTYLIRREDIPRPSKAIPRYIPDTVLEHLNAHLDDLAEPVMRMTLVLMECGMRISELLHLKPDCLLQDNAGDWFLRYYQFKMKKEITIPVSRELVQVIQEQRQYIANHLDSAYEYLFCSNAKGAGHAVFRPVARPMIAKTYTYHLNRLAEHHNICDENGQLWHFRSHQFRHTVGTRMINNGVPQHIVQRYLGHESPSMTATYAHIHDQTLKAEITKFQGNVVNIAGQVVEATPNQVNDSDLKWFKRHIQAQALPNGSCALPTISQGCPHANACLTCTHFRTTADYLDLHKQQLEQTTQIIQKAQAHGWTRQVEMNQTVQANLKAIITGLEAPHEHQT